MTEDQTTTHPPPCAIWGGRFSKRPRRRYHGTRINASIEFDRRLYAQDIRAAAGRTANMLVSPDIITAADGTTVAGQF